MKCSTCGATRSHVGVMYPVRLICKCEKSMTCSQCKASAAVVEFQSRIKQEEPTDGVFFCSSHSPTEIEQLVPVANDSTPTTHKRKEKNPHVDPAWPSYCPPPPQSGSVSRVQCFGCQDTHAMNKRRMFNGTNSNCPKCGDGVFTLDMENAA